MCVCVGYISGGGLLTAGGSLKMLRVNIGVAGDCVVVCGWCGGPHY